jgi:hypothetical protein
MMAPFRTTGDYELFLYTLAEQYFKHIPPEIKHHRIPAPKMSFTHPNLLVLIQEIEDLIAKL